MSSQELFKLPSKEHLDQYQRGFLIHCKRYRDQHFLNQFYLAPE